MSWMTEQIVVNIDDNIYITVQQEFCCEVALENDQIRTKRKLTLFAVL